MAKLFFGKMNNKEDVDKGIYSAPNESYISNIEPGDYVFVKLEKEYKQAKVKRLWKLNKIENKNGEVIAHFDKICEFDPIELPKFEALDLFILNMNLLNKCNKQTKGLSFIEIDLLDTEDFENLATNPDELKLYLKDNGHYRKFIKLDNKSSAVSNNKDVHFYKDNNSWYLIDSKNYIGSNLKDNYDANQFILFGEHGDKKSNTKKAQMYKFLINDVNNILMNGEGLWDLFCGKVKSNNNIKNQKTITLGENNCDEKSGILSKNNCSSVGINKIFYGTPGCGKSYYVENTVLTQEDIIENFVYRTTFYQDYTNTDFVGQIRPKIDNQGNVTYEFNPGPFTLALKSAFENPNENVALIIEELNRGNAPNIFGDIFQLLDRQRNGTSRYRITNVNIQDYLKNKSSYKNDYIEIPRNLFIFATMNTSDQNVFTLDTAFKRRWKFKKISNTFLTEDTIGNKYVSGLKNINWEKFVKTINKHIIKHATSLSAENKQLGKYFVDEDLLMNDENEENDEKLEEFAYKVFEYLWTDVTKFNRNDWFIDDIKSLDDLIYKYSNHVNIFVQELANELPVFSNEEDE